MTSLDIDNERRPRRKSDEEKESWFSRNWLGVAALCGSLTMQAWSGGAWVFGRESRERELAAQVAQLQTEIAKAQSTYVRVDVFGAMWTSINDRLASIDRKLSEQKR